MEHDENIQIVDEDIIDFLLTTDKTYFEPGSTYRYSNTGYILLGLIVSKVTNRALNEYIETEIFKKALMFNSKANIQGKTIIDKRAYGHIIDNEKVIFYSNNKLDIEDNVSSILKLFGLFNLSISLRSKSILYIILINFYFICFNINSISCIHSHIVRSLLLMSSRIL